MSFQSDMNRHLSKADKRLRAIHANVVFKVRDSIVFGSALTGAPGQPVDTGNLRASWQLTNPEPLVSNISTNVVYAPFIEDGIGRGGAMILHSKVGGFHSVRVTRAGFRKIVDVAVKEEAP